MNTEKIPDVVSEFGLHQLDNYGGDRVFNPQLPDKHSVFLSGPIRRYRYMGYLGKRNYRDTGWVGGLTA